MADSIRAKLNPLYQPIFREFFDQPEVAETRATCETCAMCDQGQEAPVAMGYFQPDIKCCSWHPSLANYLVGAILADEGPELAEGRRRLRAKIAARIGVTPQYVASPRKYRLLYTAAKESDAFGRSKALLCPYFDAENDGRCTVWQYREAVCSTYFCKHSWGKPGHQFWNTMKGYLAHVEGMLARATAWTIDATVSEPKVEAPKITLEDLEDRAPTDADYASYWGTWVGREEAFYIACYKHVLALKADDFQAHVDETPDGRRYVAELAARYGALSATALLPRSLVRAPGMRTRHSGDKVVVASYNAYDAFSMEKELYDVLGLFDPKQTLEENLARLDKEHDVQLAPELLQYLFRHGVVVEPEAPPPAPAAAAPAVVQLGARGNRQDRRASQAKGKSKPGPKR